MVVGGILQRLVGLRLTALIGCSLITIVTFCGQWTVNNYWLFCITYGLMFGLGNGITVAAPMTAGIQFSFKTRYMINSDEMVPQKQGFSEWIDFLRLWFRLCCF